VVDLLGASGLHFSFSDRENFLVQENSGLGQLRNLRPETLPVGLDQARLTIQSVIVAEAGRAQFTIPVTPGLVNQTVRLGRWDLTVTHTEASGDQLRVYLDLGPGGLTSAANGRLTWFDLEHSQEFETVTLQFNHPEARFVGPWVMDLPVQP